MRQIWNQLPVRTWNVNKADVKWAKAGTRHQHKVYEMDGHSGSGSHGENLLFLTDDQIQKGIEAMFFAYRGFTSDPDRLLEEYAFGRAHHRALHFINRSPGTTVNNLLAILGVTKQSLNRVLRTLVEGGLVDSRVGLRDKRERNLYLTAEGATLERRLSEAQQARMRAAYRAAGPEAVSGFRTVLESMMDPDMRQHFRKLKD